MKKKKLIVDIHLKEVKLLESCNVVNIDNKLYIDLGLAGGPYTEYKTDLRVEQDRYTEFEYGVIDLYGCREETDEEYNERVKQTLVREQLQKESAEDADRRIYEKMKEWFESECRKETDEEYNARLLLNKLEELPPQVLADATDRMRYEKLKAKIES